MSVDQAGFELASPMERGQNGELQEKSGYYVIEALKHYSYEGNNPVRYVDPTGMDTIVGISIKKDKADLIGQHAMIMIIDEYNSENNIMLDASGHYGSHKSPRATDVIGQDFMDISIDSYLNY